FGGELRFIRLYTDRLGGTTYTYSNLNSFLTNTPQSIQFLGDLSAPSPFNNGATGQRFAKQEYYIAYAEDEWKLRPNVTLNYGLRYEYFTPLREDRHLQAGRADESRVSIFKDKLRPAHLDDVVAETKRRRILRRRPHRASWRFR